MGTLGTMRDTKAGPLSHERAFHFSFFLPCTRLRPESEGETPTIGDGRRRRKGNYLRPKGRSSHNLRKVIAGRVGEGGPLRSF